MLNKLKFLWPAGFLLFPLFAFAHEAYVLDQGFFWSELGKSYNLSALNALKNPHDLWVTIVITICVIFIYFLNYLFRKTKVGFKVHSSLEKLSAYGPLFVRVTIATAFLFSAASMSFLGPELKLAQMPYAHLLQILLYASSVMILLGLFTEIAALLALIIFCLGFFVFGSYLITYLNYLGEMIVLLIFGMRKWSLDGWFFGPNKLFADLEKYKTVVVRVCYGLALIWAAVTVKFLHPALTLEVVNHWNLTQFHFLFPNDPLLVTLGAGLAEFAIGFFILVGFEMRLTVLISLFYITLSLLFFRELVWPHLLLYGISLNLLVEPEHYTLDNLIFRKTDGASK